MKTLYLTIAAAVTFLASSLATAWAVEEYPGGDPGPAKVKETGEEITLSNKLFSITMQKLGEPGTKPKRVSDPLGGTKSVGGQVLEFKEMKLADGTKVFSGVDSFFQINDKMWNSGVMAHVSQRILLGLARG